jgi:formate hydrogenlyase transcriptional activator
VQQNGADDDGLSDPIANSHHHKEKYPTEVIVGQSDALQYVLFKVEQVAPYDTTVLLLGETGTGKELVAHAIHALSPRRDRPLVKVNCAALPSHLIESELFGHEKGAFTGAHTQQVGRFDVAHGGTLLLDEIGELPLDLQAKLLRVLQDGAFQRVGSPRTIRVDVRVIAATNRHLEAEVRQGRFREDLYYRLQVFPITVPPLRDRREDIPLLVHALVKKFNTKLAKTVDAISPDTMTVLQNYPWPGNVRELENVIERAVITTQGATLRLMETLAMPQALPVGMTRRKTLEEAEIDHIVQTLDETHWRIEGKDGAAATLGLNPSTLRGRMQKHRIHRPPGRHRR